MEGFQYVDIFSTKGVEYLLVIGFMIAFVLMWKLMRAPAMPATAFTTKEIARMVSSPFSSKPHP